MHHRCKQGGDLLHGREQRRDEVLVEKQMHPQQHVGTMLSTVVQVGTIVTLNLSKKIVQLSHIERYLIVQVVSAEQFTEKLVHGVAAGFVVKSDYIKLPTQGLTLEQALHDRHNRWDCPKILGCGGNSPWRTVGLCDGPTAGAVAGCALGVIIAAFCASTICTGTMKILGCLSTSTGANHGAGTGGHGQSRSRGVKSLYPQGTITP
eukprot:1677507-Prymnesium_polylepis.2